MITLSSLLQINRALLRLHCKTGDTVLDATVGNGKDTVFLAQLVGSNGIVVAMDKQKEAIDKTAGLLEVMDLAPRVRLTQAEHQAVVETLHSVLAPETMVKGLSAAVFNLGFLPGSGNKKVITDGKSTTFALDAIWPLLRKGGLLSVHTYTGHAGGEEEARMVAEWMRNINWLEAKVTACTQHNKPEAQETLFLVEKKPI